MKIEFTGRVIKVLPHQQISETFSKQDVVIELGGSNAEYPDQILITFMKNKTSMLDAVKAGDHVYGSAFVGGRSWLKPGADESDRRWFNSFNGIEIEKAKSHTPTKEPVQVEAEAARAEFDKTEDELPF